MKPPREQIMRAVLTQLMMLAERAGVQNVRRRVVRFRDAGPKPCICIAENGDDYSYQSESLQKITINADLLIYTEDGMDASPEIIPVSAQNHILDAIDELLKPDQRTGRCTLGGLVEHILIDGTVLKIPGDLDGEGIAVVPLKILVPTIGD